MKNEIITPLENEKILEELNCPICLSILDTPVLELPNQHIFCKKCYDSYLKKNGIENNPICPICKTEISSIIEPKFINNMLSLIQMKCTTSFEGEVCTFQGNAIEYYKHVKNCEILKKLLKNKLEGISTQMKEILDKEINPHLKSEHLEIFEKYVKEWEWLIDTNKDWKWWWWADNEWWGNKPCKECNDLWHKYEDDIQVFENQRISLLNSI